MEKKAGIAALLGIAGVIIIALKLKAAPERQAKILEAKLTEGGAL